MFLPLFVFPVTAAEKPKEDQAYTDTEEKCCNLAVRAEVFDGFGGEVQVLLRDFYGREETCTLTAQNGYAWNLSVAEGDYRTVDVTAREGEHTFEVKRLSSRLQAEEGKVTVCRLVVTEYEMKGQTEAPLKEGEMEEEMEMERQMAAGIQKEKKPLFGKRFSLVLWLAALGTGAVYWYLRYGRKKYGGR